jgi:hypothetical protein
MMGDDGNRNLSAGHSLTQRRGAQKGEERKNTTTEATLVPKQICAQPLFGRANIIPFNKEGKVS